MDTKTLAAMMGDLYHRTIIKVQESKIADVQKEFKLKQSAFRTYLSIYYQRAIGTLAKTHCDTIQNIQSQYAALADHLDGKLMIFIVGNGNAGKSTLLNALVGKEMATTDELPNTWKIDVYTPSVKEQYAELLYNDGRRETITESKAKTIVLQEEEKTKQGKDLYNKELKENIRKYKTKEERDEYKKYLSKKHIYKSPLVEVRWHVSSNHLLEQCMLVDTPGLNQTLNDEDQIGSIGDYYNKADGVIWLLDGTTIAAANTQDLIQELTETLSNVGGIRNNIIGVINRMDLVYANGGNEAVNKVMDVAQKSFGQYFSALIPISARDAYIGIANNQLSLYESSNIKSLITTIEDIFIAKADIIRREAKRQGNDKLERQFYGEMNRYIGEYNEYFEEREEKTKKTSTSIGDYYGELCDEIDVFFTNYMEGVSARTNEHIDALGNGEGAEYIKQYMYQLNYFQSSCTSLMKRLLDGITQKEIYWKKNAVISEYKYIDIGNTNYALVTNTNYNINVSDINNIRNFTPMSGGDIFSMLGNLIGGIMFEFRKGSIINKIINTMQKECDRLSDEMKDAVDKRTDQSMQICCDVLHKSFASLYWDDNNSNTIIDNIDGIRKHEAFNIEESTVSVSNIIMDSVAS